MNLPLNTASLQPSTRPALLSGRIIAWTVVLLVSDLPDALWQALTGGIPTWLFWAKIGGLSCVILLGWVWKEFSSLRPFFILLLILAAGRRVLSYVGMMPGYVAGSKQDTLLLRLAQFEGSRLMLTAFMLVALLALEKPRQGLFQAKGNLEKWKRLGIILALSIMALTILFFDYPLSSVAAVFKALPLMPAALFFAALAALDEEIRCRAALLPHLADAVGPNHSIMMTAFYFGMGHYFGGVPSGLIGFLIAGGLGWLYAAMMLETRGIFMPWLNHWCTNIPTFIFWAIASVSP